MQSIEQICTKIKQNNSFLVMGHVSPDGDTLGSGMALVLALKSVGKSAIFVVDGVVPDKLKFVEAGDTVYAPDTYPKAAYDMAVAVDVSDATRLGDLKEVFVSHPNTMVIDHHITNKGFGNANMVLPYGATGQIILEILELLQIPLSKEIANMLYAALSTDTGNFSYENTDASLLHAAARLRAAGADIPMLTETIYKQRTFAATQLIGEAASRIELSADGKIAFTYVLQADFDALQALPEDTDELINYAREIIGVEVAIFAKEQNQNVYKVSLRSKQYVDVSALAAEFDGGGHKRAAGCTIEGSLAQVKQKLIDSVIAHMNMA